MILNFYKIICMVPFLILTSFTIGHAATDGSCDHCGEWNQSQKPFRIFGNTYYVGVMGLSSILITSKSGHILIDGGLPESSTKIAKNIRALGFNVDDIKFILNSHVHFDHAGGISNLEKLTGATVLASKLSAQTLLNGRPGVDDPQYKSAIPYSPVKKVSLIEDGQIVRLGPLAVRAHLTPGHTPGGTTWSWASCEYKTCYSIAYVDSLTAVSDDHFRFSDSSNYPNAVQDFKNSFKKVESLNCDILITPHPDFAKLYEKLAKRESGVRNAFVEKNGCRNLSERARANFERRLAKELTEKSKGKQKL